MLDGTSSSLKYVIETTTGFLMPLSLMSKVTYTCKYLDQIIFLYISGVIWLIALVFTIILPTWRRADRLGVYRVCALLLRNYKE